jgi:hypothetical protein
MKTLREILRTAADALEAVVDDNHIKVWRFINAPPELQALAQSGGDEDWLALVPDNIEQEQDYIAWIWGGHFGRCSVDEYPIAGAMVYIGCHT